MFYFPETSTVNNTASGSNNLVQNQEVVVIRGENCNSFLINFAKMILTNDDGEMRSLVLTNFSRNNSYPKVSNNVKYLRPESQIKNKPRFAPSKNVEVLPISRKPQSFISAIKEEKLNECPHKNQISFNCKYWVDKCYKYIKLDCCDIWYCCIYCHMDASDHKAKLRVNKAYCLKCKKESSDNNCPNCQSQYFNSLNTKQVAERCRFFKNKGYFIIPFCCQTNICCYRCHNKQINHTFESNLKYLCVNCSREAPIGIGNCASCCQDLKNYSYNYQNIASTCPYFKKLDYLIEFRCCGNVYCCLDCHNSCENHKGAEKNKKKICIKCEVSNRSETSFFYCSNCSFSLGPPIKR